MKENTTLNYDSLHTKLKDAKYAIRGPVLKRARELGEKLKKGEKLPFDKIYRLHNGNPQVLGHVPNAFFRDVLAVAMCPKLLESSEFSKDVKERAESYLKSVEYGAIASYSDGPGFPVFRESIKDFLERRDGHPAKVSDIFLINGATDGMEVCFSLLLSEKSDAFMLPKPEFPGYGFLIHVHDAQTVYYELDEDHDWEIDITELEQEYKKATERQVAVRALVIINPNNPTGSILSQTNLEKVIKFCWEHKIIIIADEVYQDTVYEGKFISLKKAICESKEPYNLTQLISVHSTSKGMLCEAGLRGGFMEFFNIDPLVISEISKWRDISCMNIAGSIATEVMCNPPREEVNSAEVVAADKKERQERWECFASKAKRLSDRLNKMKNITCDRIRGAMYGFPRIHLTESAIAEAKKREILPDEFFCLELLENTGITVIPGSGFGQKSGTYHFRTTNLIHSDKEFEEMLDKMEKAVEKFFTQYP